MTEFIKTVLRLCAKIAGSFGKNGQMYSDAQVRFRLYIARVARVIT